MDYVRWFQSLSMKDVPLVGGKNASLGEMFSTLKGKKIDVPNGFAITADAYWDFLRSNHIDEQMRDVLDKHRKGKLSLEKTGSLIRGFFLKGHFSDAFVSAVKKAYRELCGRQKNVDV